MSWLLFFPELFYFVGGMAFLCLSMSNRSDPQRNYYIALVLAAVGVVVCLATVKLEGFLFFNTYRVDLFSQVFKLILALGFFLIISICS
ncbi:MAG: NADH-quinone oxidoreductase subunit N, partial [Desulfobacterales bacterium]